MQITLSFHKDKTYVKVASAGDWKSPLRGDIDNYIKLALDGIQRAGLIANDRQVMQVDAVKI